MEPKDYINEIMTQWASAYIHADKTLLKSDISANDSNYIFTTQSMADFFNELTTWSSNDSMVSTNDIIDSTTNDTNPSAPNKDTSVNVSSFIGHASDLIKNHGYKSTQCIVIHNRHFEKVQKLLHDFYKISITEGPNKAQYEQYMNTLIFLNTSFKTNQNVILTKAGMQYCNDIYNWYESIKGYINNFGA